MSVVVVNCSAWPGFPSQVRTLALDLYQREECVEFWHAAEEGDPAIRIWGNWPKTFREPWLLGDELADLVISHAAALDKTEDNTAHLTVIVLIDADAPRAAMRKRAATKMRERANAAMRALDYLRHLAGEDDHAAKLRRSLWRIGVIGNPRASSERRRAWEAAAAWKLVTPQVSGRPGQDGSEPAPAFDSVVVIEGGPFAGIGDGAFFALRALIDIARDPQVRDKLKPGIALDAQRVLRLQTPSIKEYPSSRVLSDLARLAQEREQSPVRDETSEKLTELINQLEEHKSFKDDKRLAEVPRPEEGIKPEPSIEDFLHIYFPSQTPSLTQLADQTDSEGAADLLTAAGKGLDSFLNERHQQLRAMRREQDKHIRDYKNKLKEIAEAATDRTFGQSGHMLHAIEISLRRVQQSRDCFIKSAEDCRTKLNDEYHEQFEAARAAHRKEPLLSDFSEFGDYQRATSRFTHVLANATNGRHLVLAGLVFLAYYVVLVAMVLAFGRRGPLWAWSTALSVITPTGVAATAGLALFLLWKKLREDREIEGSKVKESYDEIVNRIAKVTRLALAHVASSRMAGRLEPFTRLLSYRRDDLKELSEATSSVFGPMSNDKDRGGNGAASSPPPQPFERKLADVDPQDYLKAALSDSERSKPRSAEITFPEGEMTGNLAVSTALVLDRPLALSFVPRPLAATEIRPASHPPTSPPECAPAPAGSSRDTAPRENAPAASAASTGGTTSADYTPAGDAPAPAAVARKRHKRDK